MKIDKYYMVSVSKTEITDEKSALELAQSVAEGPENAGKTVYVFATIAQCKAETKVVWGSKAEPAKKPQKRTRKAKPGVLPQVVGHGGEANDESAPGDIPGTDAPGTDDKPLFDIPEKLRKK